MPRSLSHPQPHLSGDISAEQGREQVSAPLKEACMGMAADLLGASNKPGDLPCLHTFLSCQSTQKQAIGP